ncbi:MAG: hypothetical protein MK096_09330 [Oleiphilaceae bacterium]|nr:hypothetical protein [Oleiphilaceae bacterium]
MPNITRLLQLLFILSLTVISGCSTTTSNVHDVMEEVDRSDLSYINIAVTGAEIQTALQDSGRLFELHHRSAEVLNLIQDVVRYYGFNLVDEDEADFVLDIQQALPDGGACVHGMESFRDNFTYSTSVLTLGIVPAKGAHCIVITAGLYTEYVDDSTAIGEFISNTGWVRIYAGVAEIDNYRKTVTKRDEIRALEASAAGLLNLLIEEGAFK